ncbi:hypothetical protein, partial [Stenotrophomonas maltophilia]|uniref:hypothetical protein n=1 Tax=Stenotrophomonas maltophilia TaxID=40324 RepID=UPI00313CBAA0
LQLDDRLARRLGELAGRGDRQHLPRQWQQQVHLLLGRQGQQLVQAVEDALQQLHLAAINLGSAGRHGFN